MDKNFCPFLKSPMRILQKKSPVTLYYLCICIWGIYHTYRRAMRIMNVYICGLSIFVHFRFSIQYIKYITYNGDIIIS